MKLDDYTLASYLAGETPTNERKSVAAALVQDYESREILHMACLALAAAMESPETRQHLEDRAARAPARAGKSAQDRRAIRMPRAEA